LQPLFVLMVSIYTLGIGLLATGAIRVANGNKKTDQLVEQERPETHA
jgi:hypothetical protein